jgi:CHAT domain-containing protein
MQREREGFLAEFGLVRWLHNTPWPSRRLAVGTGKLFYVIPDYPVTQYVLKGAETERERLSDMFVAAPVDPDSDSVTDFLAAPPEDCAILHFACHGDARQEAVLSADLMMRGRVREGHYQPDLLSADMVGVSARFAKTTSPVVFLNACRVGQNGMTIAGAGGFAQSFLKPKSRQGAGVFVGCLWSIGDQPASTFASTFYRSLTERATLVDAAKAAREAAKSAGEFTWLAYSVYGDPMARAAE